MNEDTSNLVYLMTLNTIGESVLVEAFKEAYFFITHSDCKIDKCYKESFMFIKGTGLNITIQDYYLDYSPMYLRRNFFWKVRHANP